MPQGDWRGRTWFHWLLGLWDARLRDESSEISKAKESATSWHKAYQDCLQDLEAERSERSRVQERFEVEAEALNVQVRQLKSEIEVLSHESRLLTGLIERYRLLVEAAKATSASHISAVQGK